MHDTRSDIWSSTLVADGKVYVGTRKNLVVLSAAKEKKVLAEIRLGSQIRATPVAAEGVLYVASQHYLWAVQKESIKPEQQNKPLASGNDKANPSRKTANL